MKKKYKWILWLLVASLTAFTAFKTWNKKIDVDIYTVESSTMQHTIEETGSVVSSHKLTLSTEVGGKVTYAVPENSSVKRGALLLSVDHSDIESQIEQLEANLQTIDGQKKMNTPTLYPSQIAAKEIEMESTSLEIEKLQKEIEDGKILYESGAISEDELEKLKLSLEQLTLKKQAQQKEIDFLHEQSRPKDGMDKMYEGQSKAVSQQIALLKSQKKKTDLFSPIDGIISHISVKKGEFVPPSSPIVTISDEEHLQVEAYLLTEDIIYLHVGDKVNISQETNGEDFHGTGKIIEIAPFAIEKMSGLGLNEKKVKVTVSIEEKEDLHIFENYDVTLHFILKEMENALTVPKSSVFSPEENIDAVFVIKEGKAHFQKVDISYESNDVFVISKGLSAGDEVVRNPNIEGLKEGSLVHPMEK